MTDKGYTIVEVLAAVSLIGILGAVSIPTYLAVKDKATDSISQVRVSPEQCATDILANHGLGLTDIFTATPVPNAAKDQLISECLLPYINPATPEIAR